jgi:hypothetical protein
VDISSASRPPAMLKLEEILNIEYLAIAYDKKKRIEYYRSPTDPEKLAALEGCAVYCLRLCHSASQLAYAPAVKLLRDVGGHLTLKNRRKVRHYLIGQNSLV